MMMRPVHLLLIAVAIGIQAATDEAYLDSMIDDGVSAGRRGGPGSLTTSGSFMMAANRAGNDEEEFGEADEDPSTPQADLAKPSGSDSLSVGEVLDADVGGRRRRKSKGSRRRRKRKGSRRRRKSKGSRRRRKSKGSRKVLRTPVLLAFCEKSWPFQVKSPHERQKAIPRANISNISILQEIRAVENRIRKDRTIHACVKCRPDAPLPFAIGKHGKRLIWACDANKFKNKKP